MKDSFSVDGSDRIFQEWLATWLHFYFDPTALSALIERAVPDFDTARTEGQKLEVHDLDAHGILCQIAAVLIETGNPLFPTEGAQPLPDPLRAYIAAQLRGELHTKRRAGRPRLLGRDLTIAKIVEEVAERNGLARYDRKSSTSAAHAVAEAMHLLDVADIDADRVGEIFRTNRDYLRKL